MQTTETKLAQTMTEPEPYREREARMADETVSHLLILKESAFITDADQKVLERAARICQALVFDARKQNRKRA